jgi:YD repeat-containing protein
VGRAIKSYEAYEPSGFVSGSNPASVATAIVMTQQEMTWDAAGNMLSSTTRQRFDDATDEKGELQDPGNVPKARVSYMASYSDAIGRNFATADYGTNGAAAWSRPPVAPLSSDTVLVATTTFDVAGNAVEQTDPMGQQTRRILDNADRLTATVENSSGGPGETRTTLYEYTDDGWLTRLISSNPATGEQVTQWLRGVTPAQGSALYSNRLVYQKVYPDSSDAGDCITYLYNRQLQVTGMTDQAGTVHSYGYDKLRFIKPVFIGDTIYTIKTDLEKSPKYPEMGLYKASYEVFKNEGELVLYCEHLQTVKYRDPAACGAPPRQKST